MIFWVLNGVWRANAIRGSTLAKRRGEANRSPCVTHLKRCFIYLFITPCYDMAITKTQ
ncbi:unnamed protein product [Brassica oleracea var. botrytis]|uniref:(rape) hypothetical protein n=1 Tax=Brassica napus TaxID=3708 RepID=A0A816ILA5_BRANA|nr:unnamed protein product [Brassica napus]